MTEKLKLWPSIPLLFLTTNLAFSQMKEHFHGIESHSHTNRQLDSLMNQFSQHKLLFPSNVPDRIILNLTEDPTTSIAVNWRTSLNVSTGVVESAKATDGLEFRLNSMSVTATTESLEVSRKHDP